MKFIYEFASSYSERSTRHASCMHNTHTREGVGGVSRARGVRVTVQKSAGCWREGSRGGSERGRDSRETPSPLDALEYTAR